MSSVIDTICVLPLSSPAERSHPPELGEDLESILFHPENYITGMGVGQSTIKILKKDCRQVYSLL